MTVSDHDSLSARQREPIAIVGIGCRLPGGVRDAASLWQLMLNRCDAIGDVPPQRWNHAIYYHPEPGRPGKTVARQAGFVDGIDLFDCGFFGISPREAGQMDPQHRLLLEVSWEAIDDSGISHDILSGSEVGVFMGISTHEYPLLQTIDTISTYSSTGQATCMAANRISYALNFIGPSVAVDTACSSSLVAVHLACTSIWNNESSLALAGGVNLFIDPDTFVGFSNLSMLSPDSRCFAFDARANGFVRSEGAGVIVLKPLQQAVADGDRIHAVILGTAVNQDGHSQGLTFPSQASQEKMLRAAYAGAGVEPERVCYVEAHGTGTQAGDPVETNAIGHVLGQFRPDGEALLIGSVKTNIGHLEAGAGIAGIIKACLSLKHRLVPPNLHFEQANPKIRFADLKLKVPVAATPLDGRAPLVAGVNSFGFGGTNAHVVLAEPPLSQERQEEAPSTGPFLLPLSARSPEALKDVAASYVRLLVDIDVANRSSLGDICYTASVRRTHHPFRLAVTGSDSGVLRKQLEACAAGEKASAAVSGRAAAGACPRLAFVFTGQGSQWWGMGRELLEKEPIFRGVVERCDRILTGLTDWSLLAELATTETASRMDQTAFAQPALFALQAGLVALWRSWGVVPDAVVGHSVGEIAAAYAAGIMNLDEAMRVAVHRGRLMDRTTALGRMLAVGAAYADIAPYLAGFEEKISLAAINSPFALTLSGDPQALEEVSQSLKKAKIGCKYLAVNYAFHSHQMEPVRDELLAALQELVPNAATTRIFSTVTGEESPGTEWTAGYWWQNLRQAVRFEPAVSALVREGYGLFLEIGPQPALAGPVKDCLRHLDAEGSVLASLQKGKGDRETLLVALASLHVQGVQVNWREVGPAGRTVALPAYPWQKERCWSEDESRRRERFLLPDHPLLGTRQLTACPTWSSRLDQRIVPYLKHHTLQGIPVFPATGYLEMALAAGRSLLESDRLEIEEVTFETACFIPEGERLPVEFRYDPEESRFGIFSRGKQEAAWTRHATGRLLPAAGEDPPPRAAAPGCMAAEFSETVTADTLYQRFIMVGLDYGENFRGVRQVSRGAHSALGEVVLPSGLEAEAGDYLAHPALLDSCFQVILAALPQLSRGESPRGAFLPVSIERLRLYRRPGLHAFSLVTLRSFSEEALCADLHILDARGAVMLEVKGLRCQSLAGDGGTASPLDELLFASHWQAQPPIEPAPAGAGAGSWLVFADRSGLLAKLEERLDDSVTIIPVRPGPGFARDGADGYRVDPGDPQSMRQLLEAVRHSGAPPLGRIVHLWGVDSRPHSATTLESLAEDEQLGIVSLLHLIQAFEAWPETSFPRLWIVTRRAQPFADSDREALSLAQAPLWGFRRVAAFEHPRLRPSIIDLSDLASADESAALLAEIAADLPEDEIVLRGNERAVHRYVRTSFDECSPPRTRNVPLESTPCHAASKRLGILDNLKLVASPQPLPAPGEVSIAVRAAGLNFADVLKSLGLYPGVTTDTVTFGAECAGIVTAIGESPAASGRAESAERLRVGQAVVALAPHCFGSFVTTPAAYAFPLPDGLTFPEAAALPIVFLTAQYALVDVGRLRKGERILIHAASGGVGLAAIQIARRVGAEIYATAGSPEKRDFLRALGVDRVMDSRSLAFADDIMAATDGEGVDLVLNSLAGEAIIKGISVLRPFGRFIEIGKRDIYANARLGLRPFRNNITFTAVDLDQAIRINPALVHQLFREVMAGFAEGAFTALPVRSFPITSMVEAFRYMSKAQHIGKIIIDTAVPAAEVVFPPGKPPVRDDATYLVTGGVEGFGHAVASWLVEQGARHIALVSRSGPASPSARQAVEAFAVRGCTAKVLAVDVADAGQLRALLDELQETMPPLRGIVHAAMVLDDGIITRLSRERLHAVTRPKVLGAWNLHQQTLGLPIDFFLMTSSVSSIFGSPGQANYAAANAFLDALAHYRHGLGLPALTLNLGAFDSVGYISRHPELVSYLANMGIPPMPPTDALSALDRLLGSETAQVGITRFDFPRLAAGPMAALMPPRFADLLSRHGQGRGACQERRLLKELAAVRPEEREALVLEALVQEMGRVLGVATDHFDTAQPLSDLGLDSLMTVELITWIEQALDLKLPTVELMRNPTTSELACLLVNLLDGAATQAAAVGAETIDLRAEAQLDPSIAPQGKTLPAGVPEDIFLTGGTGFVGAFLLRELLDRTAATIHCLVRARTAQEAGERLRKAMESYGIWDESSAMRIVPLHGDLEQPLLGLDEEGFAALAERVQAIYHCGAIVNFLKPYAALRAANVQGTREVLRLACAGAPKMLHYISSIAVFSITHYTGLVQEETCPYEIDGLPDGYSQSKWVAEQLVVAAMRQGLPVRIYRPGVLAGHSLTGRHRSTTPCSSSSLPVAGAERFPTWG